MELSLFYLPFTFLLLLLAVDSAEFDNNCPTSRRLLLFGGLGSPRGEKKSHQISSSSKSSSPPKYARSVDANGLTVYIRPQTSHELGHKVRSYSHLLKPKAHADEEKPGVKKSNNQKKKQSKKKSSQQHKSSTITKTQELVAVDNDQINHCKALLHVDTTSKTEKKSKITSEDKSIKKQKVSNAKNVTQTIDKKEKPMKRSSPVTTPTAPSAKKDKIEKKSSKTTVDTQTSGKTLKKKVNENQAFTSSTDEVTIKSSPPPTPPPQPTTNTKSKRSKPETIPVADENTESFNKVDDEFIVRNESVVGRAYMFVKNMFQLSDDLLNESHSHHDQYMDMSSEQENHQAHHSRKLLSIDDPFDVSSNNDQFPNDLSLIGESIISKRKLLSAKVNKHSTSSTKTINVKQKKNKSNTNLDGNKPKVGWAYRYRISRYLEAQKMKRTGNKNKGREESKSKVKPKQTSKSKDTSKSSSGLSATLSKRKLLEYNCDDDNKHDSYCNKDQISKQDIIKTVTITETFIPKRQLLASQAKRKRENENTIDNEDKINTRQQIKSYDELTDPKAIVNLYDRGLYKPRVGWQFRYRVSRYIDALRDNIREDQERLKLGLQAIKRKTPQEISGRRKRVLDKPFKSDTDKFKKEQTNTRDIVQENKPSVGWRYRYRISKMMDAKKRGVYIDDRKEKHAHTDKTRLTKPKDEKTIEKEENLDPELRKVSEENRHVGWAYRYRIRRKLDDLKQQQKTVTPFDIRTSSNKKEKKPTENKPKVDETNDQKSDVNIKSVGWKYRYRVSKMQQDQNNNNKAKSSASKSSDSKSKSEKLDPKLAELTPEERTVGWKYRYRIRRKLDSVKNDDNQAGQRKKKSKTKQNDKKEVIKKVEESIENILNIEDIDETPFMEYFRRSSSYFLSSLLPTAKRFICVIPLPRSFSFCNSTTDYETVETIRKKKKKLKTKKAERAKQFIRSRPTKLGAEDKYTERRVDETMKNLYKVPSLPPPQDPPLSTDESSHEQKQDNVRSKKATTKKTNKNQPEKIIAVEAKKSETKKKSQIIGQEAHAKQKHQKSSFTIPTTHSASEKSPPIRRSLSEVIQAEASSLLLNKRSFPKTTEEVNEAQNEANEVVQERAKLKAAKHTRPTILTDDRASVEENIYSTSSDNNEKTDRENIKETIYNILDLDNDKNSS